MSQILAKKRAVRNRARVRKCAERSDRLRLSVFRSETHIYAQIINDVEERTLVSASTIDKKVRKDIKKGSTIEAAKRVGEEIAKRAKEAGVVDVYFDRGAFRYHGRVKALADAAREGGLNF